ncbi:heptaprenyl diphosphate synthase [Sporomusaceae bacterium BoRhaA]|uniref:polyprenyl synthetase family protein n=1 Tax=Pelorhabdus rhamnosifermentans TaxID=2772457 RepID=UPI0028B25270|nr:polyprenyl synthetase family protein [Pelorhabdus rhamnosifermentans]MBU2702372.1 heptaprenyl diphosphate synthase [Pelorhabdus rhamnosifermentans]
MKRSTIFDLVQNELMAIKTELASAIRSQDDLVTDMGSHLFLAGGKCLRPGLYFLCARNSRKILSEKMPVAVAIELIHMATLVHDDILDNAAVRRGVSTANARWGNHASVLAGDYLFAKAFSLIAEANAQALKVLSDVICAICEGEVSQIRDKFNPYRTEADYLKRIAQKTACFIAVSCELGAMAAQLDTTTVKALHQYGYAVGMAYQITDDILDITASEEQIGKPVGNDLRQGVLTLPVIYVLRTSPRQDELQKLILAKDMSDSKLQQCMNIIHETSAVEYTYQRMSQYLELARQSIPSSLDDDVREALHAVVDFVGRGK